MAIRVTDVHGELRTYDEDSSENGSLETETVHNNLVIETDNVYVVFAEGQWLCAEQDNPNEVESDSGDDPSPA